MENNIQYWREYYGISQRKLAEKVGISHSELSCIENDKKLPSVLIALNIAKALKRPVEELFVDDGCKLSLCLTEC